MESGPAVVEVSAHDTSAHGLAHHVRGLNIAPPIGDAHALQTLAKLAATMAALG